MNTIYKLLTCVLLCCTVAFVGCGQKNTDTSTANNKKHSRGPDGNSSDDGDQSHGDKAQNNDDGGHTHGVGPHGGAVADWGGGKFHIELIVDRESKTASVYVLGDNMSDVISVNCKSVTLAVNSPVFSFELNASPHEFDIEGRSSCFVGTHDELQAIEQFAASVSGLVGDTPYSGNFPKGFHTAAKAQNGDIGSKDISHNTSNRIGSKQVGAWKLSYTQIGNVSDDSTSIELSVTVKHQEENEETFESIQAWLGNADSKNVRTTLPSHSHGDGEQHVEGTIEITPSVAAEQITFEISTSAGKNTCTFNLLTDGFEPNEAQKKAVLSKFNQYLRLVDSGSYKEAFEMLSESQTPFGQWKEQHLSAKKLAGSKAMRRNVSAQWNKMEQDGKSVLTVGVSYRQQSKKGTDAFGFISFTSDDWVGFVATEDFVGI